MNRLILTKILLLQVLAMSTEGAGVRVEWFNSGGTELLTLGGDPLDPGTTSPGDGAILALGFYTLGTPSSPFSGAWRPLTGPGTVSPGTTIGGKGTMLAGQFDWSNSFGPGVLSEPLPAAGTPLVIRFFDSPSLDTATYFNAVSNSSGSWNWVDPTDPQTVLNLSLTDPGLVWQDGPDSAFRTTIFIPEPAVPVLVMAALPLVLLRRRRSSI